MRQEGIDVQVDHIYPLHHPYMCGLHVPANLEIAPRERNRWKGNRHYPDHPQLSLFPECDPFWTLCRSAGSNG